MKKIVLLPILLIVIMAVIPINTTAYKEAGIATMGGHEKEIQLYVIGKVPHQLREIVSQAGLVAKVTQYSVLREVPSEKGIVVITRPLAKSELSFLTMLLRRGDVVITLNDIAKNQVDSLLSEIAAFTASFNGTHTYLYKILSGKSVMHGRLPVIVKGYAGRGLSGEVVKDAAEILSYETQGWLVIGWVGWSSNEAWRPYGKLNLEHAIFYYEPDPWTNMDLFGVRCTTQIISGAKLGWEDSYHGMPITWLNDYIKSDYYLQYYTNIYDLRDYYPGDMSNVPSSITVTLTWPPAASLTWSYPGNHILSITDNSDLGANNARWVHDLGELLIAATKETVKIDPGFEFTISPETTGTQRWVITAGWLAPTYHNGPLLRATRTVVVEITFYYG